MSNYFNLPVIGIDVAANFSVATALDPSGNIFKKNLKFNHTLEGFNKLLQLICKIEKEFDNSPKVFCESTGIYHLTLLHFLIDHQIDIRVINPLITNSNKNFNIRKVKNDKMDSFSIATLCKYQPVKTSMFTSREFLHLKSLVREYYKINDLRADSKKAFSNALYVYYPGLQHAFTDITGKTPLAFIRKYPTPKHLLEAKKVSVISFLQSSSRRGLKWATNKYDLLLEIANGATVLSLNPSLLEAKVLRFLQTYDFYSQQLGDILNEIRAYIDASSFADGFNQNLSLLLSFKGIGYLGAVTLLTEMGDINNFSNANQLVAYFGIDPGVNESGNFKGDRNKMSKRGTSFGRRALYALALASIRTTKNKVPMNSVLYKFYNETLINKKKKVRLVAVMNKLLRYIFSVLKNQKPYEVRQPNLHKRMFLENNKQQTVAA